MSPLPHGHTPARARARMLLPAPESPVSSTFSPGLMATSAPSTTAVPSSSVTETSRNRSAASFPPPRAILPLWRLSERSSASSASSSKATRRAEAAPVRKARIIVDEPVERRLHDCERRCCLHDFAERHRVVQEFWRVQNDRQDRRYVTAGLRDNRSP